jgi:hypothetical protein
VGAVEKIGAGRRRRLPNPEQDAAQPAKLAAFGSTPPVIEQSALSCAVAAMSS